MTASCRATQRPEAADLLAWYDIHRRELPWRARAGLRADPYRVWLSEIMLQQTTVQAVARYYRNFLERWPTVKDLAAAPLDDVLAAWAGLGYYARARNLHRTAKVVAEEFGGRFPETAEGLRKLPGVGAYTAGAIAAIAFDEREAAMDANAERVVARLFAVEEPLPKAKPKLHALAQELVPERRAGDFAQALMDLGATICTPKKPACGACPWKEPCRARQQGTAESLPRKAPLRQRPLKCGAAFVARDKDGAVLLVKRPEKGLLGGMLEPPMGPWTDRFPSAKEALLQAPFRAAWKKRAGVVRHGFTHFELEIEVYVVDIVRRPKPSHLCHSRPSDAQHREGKGTQVSTSRNRSTPGSPSLGPLSRTSPGMTRSFWLAKANLVDAALPTVMRKIVAHALYDGGPLSGQPSSARIR